MEYTTTVEYKNEVKSIKTKIDKFKDKVAKTQEFISNHKKISEDEAELVKLSFETLISIVDKKHEEL